MKTIGDRIRDGIVTSDGENHYCSFIIDGNFFLYRFVKKGIGYRGNNYYEDGYVLVFADNQRPPFVQCPAFIGCGDL